MNLIKKYALNYLSKYDSSKKNLELILRKKINRLNLEKKDKYLLFNSIDTIILELEKKNIINDNNYIDRKILNLSSQAKSKNFIANYLLQKGLNKDAINMRLREFELNNEDWEYQSAKLFIIKKKINIKNKEMKQKYLSKMSRAGFNYSLCKKILEL
tara:strand:+ start:2878 stop:3348 length:471 start_codon:yes stop_codon:yes gene_type:complete